MSAARRAEIAKLGGKAAHAQGKANVFTKKTAKRIGALGGLAISGDKAHMSRIGKLGGKSHTKEHMQKISRLAHAK